MGGLPLPKLQRCCFCTRKLKVACLLIAIWSMLVTTHCVRILFCPVCTNQYTEEDGYYHEELTIVMWVLFTINLLTICSSFAYLLGLFLGLRITADIFMACGFLSAALMFIHSIFTCLQMIHSTCNNPSDIIAFFIYIPLWIYFILIVNSHRDNM